MHMSQISMYVALAVLILVMLIAVPVVLLALAPMTFSGLIERYVRSEIGIDMTIQDLAVTLFPLEVEVAGLVLRNPDPAFEEPLLASERLRAEIHLRGYLDDTPTWWRGTAEGIEVRVERDEQGNTNWDVFEDEEPSEPLRENALLQFDAVQISDLTLLVVADQEPHRFEIARLVLDKDLYHRLVVDLEGRYGDEPLIASGTLALPHPRRTSEVAFHAEVFGGEILVDGVIGHDGVTPGKAQFRAAFGDLSALGVLLGEDLSALEPLVLNGVLGAPAPGHWQIDAAGELAGHPVDVEGGLVLLDPPQTVELSLKANVVGAEFNVDGAIGPHQLAPGQVQFHVALPDLTTVGALFDDDLNQFGPVELQGEIAMPEAGRWRISTQGRLAGQPVDLNGALVVGEERYRLHQLDLTIGESALQATGELALDERRVLARIRAPRLDLDRLPLKRWFDEPEEPRELHEIAAALPVGEEIEQWTAEVGGRVDRLHYGGALLSGLEFELEDRDAALELDLRLAALRRETNEETGWELVEPLRLTGRLSRAERAPEFPSIEARLTTAGFEAVTTAVLPVTREGRFGFSLQVEMTALEAVEGLELARFEPLLPFAANLEGVRDGTLWRIELLDARIAGEPASGRLLIDPEAEPLLIRGDLHARELDMRRLVDVEEAAEEVEEEAEQAEQRDVPLFSDEPLEWAWLDAATVDVRARVDRLPVEPLTLRNVRAEVRLRDAVLTVDPLEAELADGALQSRLHARQHDGGGAIDVRMLATGLTPADLGVADDMIRGGATSVSADLQSRGQSARELAEALNGEFAMEVRRAVVKNEMIDMLGADVVAEVVRLILPFIDREERTDLQCAAAHVLAIDGVLVSSDHVVLETVETIVRASAVVDLRDESLEINFEPEAREDVEIGIADVADLVQVRGSITDPEVEVDPEGVAGAVATAAAAVATAGTSLLVQALLEDDDDGTPCRAVFATEPAEHELEEEVEEQID
jgi:uncharacterized protein involved in outer membrane biogenesis